MEVRAGSTHSSQLSVKCAGNRTNKTFDKMNKLYPQDGGVTQSEKGVGLTTTVFTTKQAPSIFFDTRG